MGILEDQDMAGVPTIPEFYKGKTVFITGGSGFMGKVLIEKLLYSCSDLDRIYVLMRPKKEVKSEDRLQDLYNTACFERLKSEKPNIFESKVFVVSGDVMEIGLGLSEEDRALLVNRVNIIYHVAASVRFNDSLPYAVKLNLRGTAEVIELAKEVRDLAALVHVSTSYSNTNRELVEEVLYPPHADWRDTLNICENIDEHTISILTAKYLGELPNTYVFTKQLAEHVVHEQRGKLPIIISRPSIVISSADEPIPGWIENFNGPVAIMVAAGKGIMRSLYTEPDLVSDYVPVDMAIKALIAASWVRGVKKLEPTDDIPIYNCCTSNLKNMTMHQIMEVAQEVAAVYPLNTMMWYPGGNITNSKTLHYFKVLILHLLPALIVDGVLMLLNQKPLLVKVQRRIYTANLALQYYITQQWTFDNKNFFQLRSLIKEDDKQHFYYNIEILDTKTYFLNCVLGGRRYLLHEKDEDLPKAKTMLFRMWILHCAVTTLLSAYLFWWFINTNFAQACIHSVLDIF